MKFPLLSALLALSPFVLFGQADSARTLNPLKTYTTARLDGEPPDIDGNADDAAWSQVPWGGGDFTQTSPDAGAAPSVQTYFKMLYDDKNLYILFRNMDPDPSKIVSRMSRRDGFDGDWVEINIDSYYDKRTAFSFTSSVSGVKGDEYISNDGEDWDENWDPIWYLKTSIVEEGWIAEVKIPLSQLRFSAKDVQVWGIQFTRRFFRNQERSTWQYIPPDASGWVHLFGEMDGIKGIRPQRQLEIQPYILAQAESFQKEEGNPFLTGHSSNADVGLDAKVGITSDITLDLTVNPDFGQVEADPSQVNLSAFQLFYDERRPFFIEGNNILNFSLTEFEDNNLFYSRRIGREPQGWPVTDKSGDDGVDEYGETRASTTILGAAKLTGKNKRGFSWGVLESVAAPEHIEIDSLGYRRTQNIEPLTNYFVSRAQQDINKGNTIVGAMFTSTHRSIEESQLDWLRTDAYTGGMDFTQNFKDRKYQFSGKVVMSQVSGSAESITETQQSSEHYYQRPDYHHDDLDTTRTSLTGTGGTLVFGKKSGKLVYEVGYNWLSPGLELNDIGFLSQANQMTQWTWTQYRVLNPVGIFRNMRYNFIQYLQWDFDGKNVSEGYNANANLSFKNFWFFGNGLEYEPRFTSNADLRGGPAIRYPGTINYWLEVDTDDRKKLSGYVFQQWLWGFEGHRYSRSAQIGLVYRPVNALSISLSPNINTRQHEMQYVTTLDSGGETRYVVGEINQTTARLTARLTYMITPNLSVQYYGQPFGTAGEYTHFKYVTDANASTLKNLYTSIPESWISSNEGDYIIDENADGTPDFSFSNPNFNFGQFRSNMVIRWEYTPGSTLFLVWTQEQNGAFYDRTEPDHGSYSFAFDNRAHNIFLVKFTYRFLL